MDIYFRKYKRFLSMRKAIAIIYFAIMAILFLTGICGIIVCGMHNTDSFLALFIIIGLVLPIAMWTIYLIIIAKGNDSKRELLNQELENSSLSADDIMKMAEELKIDLFSVAIKKRAKELGIEQIPEWCFRDGDLPTKDNL